MNYSTSNDSNPKQVRQAKGRGVLRARRRSALQKGAEGLFTPRRSNAGEVLWPAAVLLAWGALQAWQALQHWIN